MTTYAMDTRGTQHVRPRPRVRVSDDRRPQAHPAARQAPAARPRQAELASTSTRARVTGAAPHRRTAVAGGVRLTRRGMAALTGVVGLTASSAAVTVVVQFIQLTNP